MKQTIVRWKVRWQIFVLDIQFKYMYLKAKVKSVVRCIAEKVTKAIWWVKDTLRSFSR